MRNLPMIADKAFNKIRPWLTDIFINNISRKPFYSGTDLISFALCYLFSKHISHNATLHFLQGLYCMELSARKKNSDLTYYVSHIST